VLEFTNPLQLKVPQTLKSNFTKALGKVGRHIGENNNPKFF
jgi:hypothetical protein